MGPFPLLRALYNRLYDAAQRSKVWSQIQALRRGGVLRVIKAVYGLKQAPRQWWKGLHAFLIAIGFVPNKSDVCLYVLHLPGGVYVLLLLYVDDILLAGMYITRYCDRVYKSYF
jgi:hypothetical protein